MSRLPCNLRVSLHQYSKLWNGLSLAPSRRAPEPRRYSYAALKSRPESDARGPVQRTGTRRQESPAEDVDDFDSRGMAALDSESSRTTASTSRVTANVENAADKKTKENNSDSYLVEHLNGLFPPLQFPSELARRILTHGSHPSAIHGHNAGLRFIGRRVIESYLLLFLNSSSALTSTHDLDAIVDRTVNTYLLGEHVGSSWGLGRTMRWTPAVSTSKLPSVNDTQDLLRGVGLYKVQGDAVAAVVGGIYYQFGATIAQRVFHTRILPKLLLGRRPEGLPEVFHPDALGLCERMGGPDAKLIPAVTSQRALVS